jgi:hypothetical protein
VKPPGFSRVVWYRRLMKLAVSANDARAMLFVTVEDLHEKDMAELPCDGRYHVLLPDALDERRYLGQS